MIIEITITKEEIKKEFGFSIESTTISDVISGQSNTPPCLSLTTQTKTGEHSIIISLPNLIQEIFFTCERWSATISSEFKNVTLIGFCNINRLRDTEPSPPPVFDIDIPIPFIPNI